MELRTVLSTDAGMHALWDRAHFPSVRDYSSWEAELLDDVDIERHIAAGHLVPLNIRSDGTWAITLRVGEASSELSAGEQERVVVRSSPYRFISQGHVDLSGLEFIAGSAETGDAIATLEVAAGSYDVDVVLMDYDDVADKTDEHPDFIVLMRPSTSAHPRTSVDTFER